MQCDQSEYEGEGDETDERIVELNKQQCRAAKVVLIPLEKDSRRTRQRSRALMRVEMLATGT